MCDSCGCAEHHHSHTHIVLPVSGILCGHCVQQIESSLSELSGVQHVRADLETGIVELGLSDDGDLALVKQTINDLGFDA